MSPSVAIYPRNSRLTIGRASRAGDALERRSAPVRRVVAYDDVISVDGFEAFSDRYKAVMAEAGYLVAHASNGPHYDGVDGYRVIFKRSA